MAPLCSLRSHTCTINVCAEQIPQARASIVLRFDDSSIPKLECAIHGQGPRGAGASGTCQRGKKRFLFSRYRHVKDSLRQVDRLTGGLVACKLGSGVWDSVQQQPPSTKVTCPRYGPSVTWLFAFLNSSTLPRNPYSP
jgi:hypothetical protein